MSSTNPFQSPANDSYGLDDGIAPAMPITDVLFSFDGRIGRQTYWLAYFGMNFTVTVVVVLLALVVGALNLPEELVMAAVFVGLIPMAWSGLAIQVKRWHDRDKSGWWCLIGLVPYIGGLWQFIECGFLPGTPGRNTYGADPVGY